MTHTQEVKTENDLFDKRSVVELSDEELVNVQGGATPATTPLAPIAAGIAIVYAGYKFGQWLKS